MLLQPVVEFFVFGERLPLHCGASFLCVSVSPCLCVCMCVYFVGHVRYMFRMHGHTMFRASDVFFFVPCPPPLCITYIQVCQVLSGYLDPRLDSEQKLRMLRVRPPRFFRSREQVPGGVMVVLCVYLAVCYYDNAAFSRQGFFSRSRDNPY